MSRMCVADSSILADILKLKPPIKVKGTKELLDLFFKWAESSNVLNPSTFLDLKLLEISSNLDGDADDNVD